MKAPLIVLSLIIFTASLGHAKSDRPVLICTSLEDVEGWVDGRTNEKLRYTAYINGPKELGDAVVKGAFESDKRDLKTLRESKNFMKFDVLEDAWHWFELSVPKDMSTLKHEFIAYVNVYYEEHYGYNGVKMKCFVKTAETVDETPSAEAMEQLAQDMGEYFSIDDLGDLGYTGELLSASDTPEALETEKMKIWKSTDELLQPRGRVYSIDAYVILTNEGQTRGYVLQLNEDFHNEPLHDGSGTTYYLDDTFKVVSAVDWAG